MKPFDMRSESPFFFSFEFVSECFLTYFTLSSIHINLQKLIQAEEVYVILVFSLDTLSIDNLRLDFEPESILHIYAVPHRY